MRATEKPKKPKPDTLKKEKLAKALRDNIARRKAATAPKPQ